MSIIRNENNIACLDPIKNNNLPDAIKDEIENYIKEGKKIYDDNIITHPNISKMDNQDMLFDDWCISLYFTCHLLYFQNVKIKCFFTNKILTSIYSDFFALDDYGIYDTNYKYTYYLFSEGINSCILVYGAPYYLPMFIYYFEKDICYDLLPHQLFGGPYSNHEYYKKLINAIKIYKIENLKLIISDDNYIIKDTNKQIIISFANNYQQGHHFWNEVSGIDILIRTNLIKNINILLLGDFDICDIHKSIKEYNPQCKIINIADKNSIINNANVYGFISSHFILDTTKMLYFKNIIPIKLNNKFVIMIIIKADRRRLHDVENVYINLINTLIQNKILNPSETIILFDGLYKSNRNEFLKNYYDNNKDKYINIVNTIVDNIPKEIECKSLIGLEPTEVMRYYDAINFWIGIMSSSIDPISHTKKIGLIITPEAFTYCLRQQSSYIQNMTNHIYHVCSWDPYEELTIVNWHELYNQVEQGIINCKV